MQHFSMTLTSSSISISTATTSSSPSSILDVAKNIQMSTLSMLIVEEDDSLIPLEGDITAGFFPASMNIDFGLGLDGLVSEDQFGQMLDDVYDGFRWWFPMALDRGTTSFTRSGL